MGDVVKKSLTPMNIPQLILWLGVVAPTPTDNFEVQSILRQVPQKQVKDQDFSCCCSVAQLCPTFCDPMDCSMPGFPVLHYLLELAQTHAYWVGDVIQLFRPLLSPSPPVFNLFRHQGLFQWVSTLHQVAGVLELQLQQQYFQWIFGVNFL